MFSLLELDSMVLGGSKLLTYIPVLYFHLKLSFM